MGMGKGSGGRLGEGGKGVGPNSLAVQMDGVRDVDLAYIGQREDGWGEGDGHSKLGEAGNMGGGDVSWA